MKVSIIYETVEGQTGKIARFAGEVAEELGHEVLMVDAGAMEPVSLEGVDAAILAAPVHQRRHPRDFEASVTASREALNAMRTMMISVSLSAAFDEGQEEANEYLIEMKMRTGLEPSAEALVGGAVRIGKYDYFAMQVVRHVVLRGRDFDTSVGEHEFTDWDKLKESVTAFLAGS